MLNNSNLLVKKNQNFVAYSAIKNEKNKSIMLHSHIFIYAQHIHNDCKGVLHPTYVHRMTINH